LQVPSLVRKACACERLSNPKGEPRNQHARTPHHLLNGMITPNSLHFSINHSGLPDIDPDKHRLVIHAWSSSRSSSRWKRCRATRWYRA